MSRQSADPLTAACPWCGAVVGVACVNTMYGDGLSRTPHVARRHAANQAAR